MLVLMRSLALSGGPDGIRVNAIAAGLVADDQDGQALLPEVRGRIPLGRAASPDDIVDAVMFLLSADAGHISDSTLVVDGGQSLQSWSNAPRVGDFPPRISPNAPHPQPFSPSERGEGRKLGTAESPLSGSGSRVPGPSGRGGGWGEGPWSKGAADQGPSRFQDRTVLITGAAGGLGSAAARRFAVEGARLALLDRDIAAVAELAEQLIAEGHVALALEADVADERSMSGAIAATEAHFEQIDVLFNNAGVGSHVQSLVETPTDHWQEVLAINLSERLSSAASTVSRR